MSGHRECTTLGGSRDSTNAHRIVLRRFPLVISYRSVMDRSTWSFGYRNIKPPLSRQSSCISPQTENLPDNSAPWPKSEVLLCQNCNHKRESLKLQPVRNLTICTIFCAGREALIPGSVNPGNFIIYQNDTPSVFYNKSSFCSIFHFMCRWWNFLKLLEPTNLRKKHLIFSLCQCIVGLDENLLSLLGKSLCWEERVVLPDFTKPVNTERDGVQHWVWMEKRVFITNQTKSVKKQEQKEMLKKKKILR